ncbi:hypothetical protein [Psychrobacter sp. I-STPA6b]|uniref:hypothetical protein n=1 Tax=Psychrobacter sp. I-STPA6b TaxID=2585718 RepID=UPI001D0C547F|nr:hypothetical protein [Psychrobacter sp. I-STPA6b]
MNFNKAIYAVFSVFLIAGCSSEPNYFVGNLTEVEALTNCQLKIQKELKNPRSMDIEHSGIQYLTPPEKPNHEIWFQFYAQNSFGADVFHTAMCGYDTDGNIIEVRYEQNR